MRGLKDGLQVEGVEKVAVIRDRKTGKHLLTSTGSSVSEPVLIRDLGISRQFAFVHFYSVPDARAFLEQHYPTLNLGHSADRCRIAFSRERENDDRRGRRRDEGEEEWKCRVVSIPILDVRSVVAVAAIVVQRGERGTFRGVCFS